MKTLMKFYSNGDLEVLEANKLSLGASGFSFSNNLISIPRIIEYRSGKTMPNWYKYTNAPFSFFKEGIVIKGDLKADLFFDNFNRANGNLANDWVIASGNFIIRNQNAENALNGLSKAYIDTNVNDNFCVELGVIMFSGTEGVTFRGLDNENHLQFIYESNKVELAARRNNVKSVLIQKTIPIDKKVRYKLTLKVNGSLIVAYINDEEVLRYTTNEFYNGKKHGMIAYNTSEKGAFDDFKISILAE